MNCSIDYLIDPNPPKTTKVCIFVCRFVIEIINWSYIKENLDFNFVIAVKFI